MSNSNKLILGTVQLGLDYGINNQGGKPSSEEAFAILDEAKTGRIQYLDTAAAYGNSEEIIGEYIKKAANTPFKIITKFHCGGTLSTADKVVNALEKLSVPSIDTMLFHSYKDYKEHPSVLNELVEQKEAGLVRHVGVSVYHNHEIEELMNVEAIDVIQAPFNMLDNDAQKGGVLSKAQSLGKTIHTRSAFLQGLFFKPINELPEKLSGLSNGLRKLCDIQQQSGLPMHQLALAYALSKAYIDGVLIGVDSSAQLRSNIEACATQLPEELTREIDQIKLTDTRLLNPSNWN